MCIYLAIVETRDKKFPKGHPGTFLNRKIVKTFFYYYCNNVKGFAHIHNKFVYIF